MISPQTALSKVVVEGNSEIRSVTAIVSNKVAPVHQPNLDEGRSKWRSHFPKRPEAYIPMPILKPKKPVKITQSESRLISYDMVTGKEVISEITYKDLPMAAWVRGSSGGRSKSLRKLEEKQQPLNFSNLSLIPNPEDYPWSVNVKLYMSFPSGNYVASGVLIDPLHVLTAGHCVYYPSGPSGSWASSIVVVPAYENGARPYGDASAVQLHTWTGWALDGNYDHDIAVIDLDRPIGALTGWHGYGYNNNPSFYTGNTFYNPGYPAESPYNGEFMYLWYGTFDYTESILGIWYGNEVGFYKRAYGGQSGSGAYYIDGSGNRYVYAVLSNGIKVPGGPTNDVRITSTKFGHIKDDFIRNDTPSTFDLIPLDINISPGEITAGNQLSSMDYVVHNYSSASWSGTVNATVYLSTNDNISTTDIPIQSHSFTWSFSPKSSVQVSVSIPPTIPPDIPEGDYWIGVILDISDYSTENNDSDGQDASPIHVTTFTTYEEDAAWYEGAWVEASHPDASSGTLKLTPLTSSKAFFDFTGSTVKIVSIKGPILGSFDVYIDGIYRGSVDLYDPSYLFKQTVASYTGLSPGTHTLRIVSTSGLVVIDAFVVAGTATSPTHYPDSAATYAGSWTDSSHPLFTEGNLKMNPGIAGDKATFTFTGEKVRIIGLKGPFFGKAEIKIDGSLYSTVDFYQPDFKIQTTIETISGLSPGTHIVEIMATGTQNPSSVASYINIDGFDVW
jgi:V8-like Glu-specific endopeptidase